MNKIPSLTLRLLKVYQLCDRAAIDWTEAAKFPRHLPPSLVEQTEASARTSAPFALEAEKYTPPLVHYRLRLLLPWCFLIISAYSSIRHS